MVAIRLPGCAYGVGLLPTLLAMPFSTSAIIGFFAGVASQMGEGAVVYSPESLATVTFRKY